MSKKKPTHGGARPGAGRKPSGEETRETTSVRLTPTVRKYSAEHNLNLGDTLETTVRKSKGFKAWLAKENNSQNT